MSKKKLEQITKKFEKEKERFEMIETDWIDLYGIDPIEIVRNFIIEKGLKIYGGLALNELLKKKKAPIYGRNEFPDYDVFSPNAWEHAKELANRLDKMGFMFVEARGSILNDEHHQTFKVGIDYTDVLDLTQSGCTNNQIKENDCERCGKSTDNKCISVFNHIPCYDIGFNIKTQPKIYTQTYNYNTNMGLYKNKLFVCEPNWMRISMYRELTEPIDNPGRLIKVSTRLDLFNKHYPYKPKLCSADNYKKIVSTDYTEILDFIGSFVKDAKLINYGASAYNLFVRNTKNIGTMEISDYEVYVDSDYVSSGSDELPDYDFELITLLSKKFPDFEFKIQEKIMYWKEIDVDNISIIGRKKNSKEYNKLITFTVITTCMPYIQFNGIRYATIDRLKYLYYRGVALPKIVQLTESNPQNYECLLNNLLIAEKKYIKNHPKSEKGKFRRYVAKCDGWAPSKRWLNMIDRFKQRESHIDDSNYKINYPKIGYKTTIEPLPEEGTILPYKPKLSKLQKKRTKYRKLKNKKKYTKKLIHNNIL